MADSSNTNQSLSEISHLFLSNVRDLPRPGAARPQRIPPGGKRIESPAAPVEPTPVHSSVDLTPEEFAEVFGQIDLDDDKPSKQPIVTAVLASHLSGGQVDRVKEYARHYAASNGHRVGLIEVDASEFRLTCFEPGVESHATDDGGEGSSFEPRQMAETLQEMNVDIDRWLLLVLNPRLPESRELLRSASHWVMLSTCDHDGVVSAYRTLKGLADLNRPRLSLVLLDAPNEHEATTIYRKLSSVCQQFLTWPLEHQAPVESAENVAEHLVLNCRPLRDKAQLAAAPQWQIVADFLATAQPEPLPVVSEEEPDMAEETAALAADEIGPVAMSDYAGGSEPIEEAMPHIKAASFSPAIGQPMGQPMSHATSPSLSATFDAPRAAQPMPAFMPEQNEASDVVDLPSIDATATTILSAVIRHTPGALVECPIHPPMCPDATLAVDREHGLVLLAVSKAGLADFRSIAQAYQWLNQNRNLIAMAVPQFSIDCHRLPQLKLLVDHRDMTADLLQPMLEAGHVTVQAYRKLRWGAKSGLLLEAA
ncbi:hypothetical protein BH10PLA1_BH10PLA1_10260 [soil metagenome]